MKTFAPYMDSFRFGFAVGNMAATEACSGSTDETGAYTRNPHHVAENTAKHKSRMLRPDTVIRRKLSGSTIERSLPELHAIAAIVNHPPIITRDFGTGMPPFSRNHGTSPTAQPNSSNAMSFPMPDSIP
jgi:hypothetical protein